jgi:RHS repeat-associated protein
MNIFVAPVLGQRSNILPESPASLALCQPWIPSPWLRARLSRTLWLLCLVVVALAPGKLRAQGDDNPTYVFGEFNGNSTTGCSYDPYTANAHRIIPDLTVAGAVGKYPLQWSRVMNSRKLINQYLGAAGGWNHSYQWRLVLSGSGSTTPDQYIVTYPDGRIVIFANRVGFTYYAPIGVTDTFTGVDGTGYCYLDMSDGGKVRFHQSGVPGSGNYTISLEDPDQIIDPNTLVTTMTYDASDRLTEVKEPAGRKLKISYGSTGAGAGYISEVDALASDGHISQWVKYTYQPQVFTNNTWNVLTGATYIGSPVPTASYTYQTSNTSSLTPLIKTCKDVRYPGPMKNIEYAFVRSGPLSWGQLYQEKNLNGSVVTQLTGASGSVRTETRGDLNPDGSARTRTFTYGALVGTTGDYKTYLLKSYTDFLGHSTSLNYDNNGFVSSVTDAKGHVTAYERFTMHGAATKITHPTTATENPGKTIQYFYTDTTGIYLDHVIDELAHQTTYHYYPGTMTVSEIDYHDGGIETFTYNGYNEVKLHTMPSNTSALGSGGTETFAYDDPAHPGQLSSYTPPATPSDNNPGAHPSSFTYNVNDHVSTATDPRGNLTTLFHNEIGQVTILQHDDTDNSQILYAYNTDGTLQGTTEQLNATGSADTDYTYDDYKRIASVTTPGNPTRRTINFYYDANGGVGNDYTHTDAQVTRALLPSGKVNLRIYDANGRLDQATIGYGTIDEATTYYDYDNAGNVADVIDPNNFQTTYFYDERDRLIGVDDPIATDRNGASPPHTVSYTYDAASNKKSEQRANDQIVTYDTYDGRNRLLQMTVPQSASVNAITKYAWTNAGKVRSMTDPLNKVYTYDYDALNRLTTTHYPIDSGGALRTEANTYDFASNLLTFKNRAGAVQTFTYDSRNRETQYSWSTNDPPDRTLGYDDASRITSCQTVDTAGSTLTGINFTYFNDSSLKSQEEWGTGLYGDGIHRTLSYTYDPDQNRATMASAGLVSLGYGYTARNQLKTVTGDSSTIATYTYDQSGNVALRALANSTSTDFGTRDALNRVKNMTHTFSSTSGSRALNYAYDEMGNRKYVDRGSGLMDDGYTYDLDNQLINLRQNGTLSGGVVTGGLSITQNLDASGNRKTVVVGDPTPTATPTPTPVVATPTYAPVAGAYPASDYPKTITVTTTTPSATMRYTTDGSPPTSGPNGHGTVISGGSSGPATVPSGAYLKVIAYKTGSTDSAVASGQYTNAAAVATPTYVPFATGYKATDYPKTITVTTATGGATMRYTTNGIPPTSGINGYGTVISGGSSGPATVPVGGATLKVIAYKSGLTDSAIKSGAYTVLPPCATPVLNPPERLDGPRPPTAYTVNISTTTNGAKLSYTRNGGSPIIVNASSVNVTIAPNTWANISAHAFADSGYSDSGVVSGYFDNQNGGNGPIQDRSPQAKATPISEGRHELAVSKDAADAAGRASTPVRTRPTPPIVKTPGITRGGPSSLSLWQAPVAEESLLDLTMGWQSQNRGTQMETGTVTTTYTTNDLNQYTNVAGGGGGATYDANGNLASYDGWSYNYDAMNRLTSMLGPGAVTANFYYDGLGRQVARKVNGAPTATLSIWDGWNLVAEYAAGTGSPSDTFVYGAGGDLLKHGQYALPTAYFYPDAQGSTAYVADGSGDLIESYTYDFYGTPTVYLATGQGPSGVSHLFTGQKWYPELGLYDLRNRFLKPDLGRFLQPDPIGFGGDGANLYRYCGNNPANWSDPSGLDDDPAKNLDNGGSWTVGGQPYPHDPSQMPNPRGGEMPPIVGPGSLPEPFSNPGGADSLFGGGYRPRSSGEGGGGRGSGGAAHRHGRVERHIANGQVFRIPHTINTGVTVNFTFIVQIFDANGNPVGPNIPLTEHIDRPIQVDFHPPPDQDIINTTTLTKPGGWVPDPNKLPFTSMKGQLTTIQTIYFNGLKASWTHTVFADPEKEVNFQAVAYFEPIN